MFQHGSIVVQSHDLCHLFWLFLRPFVRFLESFWSVSPGIILHSSTFSPFVDDGFSLWLTRVPNKMPLVHLDEYLSVTLFFLVYFCFFNRQDFVALFMRS